VLQPSVVDIPGKNDLVKGVYKVPDDAGTIRVKITDLLSESWEGSVSNGTKRAATNQVGRSLDFAFFHFLWQFYQANRGTIRSHYKELTRKFLDFNNPEKNPKAFLRQPQFEALETYIFLKEFLGNAKVEEIFQAVVREEGAVCRPRARVVSSGSCRSGRVVRQGDAGSVQGPCSRRCARTRASTRTTSLR
jgi:hypothetical protein